MGALAFGKKRAIGFPVTRSPGEPCFAVTAVNNPAGSAGALGSDVRIGIRYLKKPRYVTPEKGLARSTGKVLPGLRDAFLRSLGFEILSFKAIAGMFKIHILNSWIGERYYHQCG